MVNFFIHRPVVSTVISILITLMGVISMMTLPIAKLPELAPPVVQIQAVYPGANSMTVEKTVAVPIEEEVNGVENMLYMSNSCSNDGVQQLNVYFEVGADPDMSNVLVQNRVSSANSKLPPEAIGAGITTKKQQTSMLSVIVLAAEGGNYDEVFLSNYMKINIEPEIRRIAGVGNTSFFAEREYAMRLWLFPDKMAAYGITPQEVVGAVKEQNLESAPGKIGQFPIVDGQVMEFVIRAKGKLSTEQEFSNIIIRAKEDGSLIRIGDVARVEFGSKDYKGITRFNGSEAPALAIYQLPSANAKAVMDNIRIKMEELSKRFPAGIRYEIPYDTTTFVDASISKVIETLLEAFLLVFLVVYIFIQDWRATLIPALAVPVSIVGTFIFMGLMGFSINLLTLFGLILAIGTVVDDAIVVIEAVQQKLEAHPDWTAKKATIESMKEITAPIITTSLVLISVFVPIAFVPGTSGILFKQFAMTLSFSVLISTINALTLSPAMAALLLRAPEKDKKGILGKFFNGFNRVFEVVTERYGSAVSFMTRRTAMAMILLVALSGGGFMLFNSMPTGFVPQEDEGYAFVDISLTPGASLQRTDDALNVLSELIKDIPEIKNIINMPGFSMMNSTFVSNKGSAIIELKNWDDRTRNTDQIIKEINGRLRKYREAQAISFGLPAVPGLGNGSSFEFNLMDLTGSGVFRLAEVSEDFVAEAQKRPELAYAMSSLDVNSPQYEVKIDEEKAKKQGVMINDLLATIQGYYGSDYVSDFNRFGKFYRVITQADTNYRRSPDDLLNIYVKNGKNEMVPISSMVTIKKAYGPDFIKRFNMATCAVIQGEPAPGYSSGDAIKAMEETADAVLPQGYTYAWSGMYLQEKISGGQIVYILIMVVIFVFLILAALYESYILPSLLCWLFLLEF
ncbi:efflux RND transporter permease subunit [bacterium SCSIO 12741]|nr:efflux RND transporter permease subunit [bacterium SCSIO 12741]